MDFLRRQKKSHGREGGREMGGDRVFQCIYNKSSQFIVSSPFSVCANYRVFIAIFRQ